MLLQNRINAFVELGSFMKQFSRIDIVRSEHVLFNEPFFELFSQQIKRAKHHNSWFTEDNILYTFECWSKLLTKSKLNSWISNYTLTNTAKNVAVIMAGNIPLVGFHDFLSVLVAGHQIVVKQSSNDRHFLPLIAKYLEYVEPAFKGQIVFSDDTLSEFDAAIATGSNNTSRYFEYYFAGYPHIIRKNRNSVAVLTGDESDTELLGLSEDVFRYFGLGCRSVSKLFVPKGYDFTNFFEAIYSQKEIIHYKKYANNYDYNKAVYLMSEFDLLENGFLILKQDKSYASPIGSLFYEYYEDLTALEEKLKADKEQIQCVVSTSLADTVNFGQTQTPALTEYADGVDTMAFLSSL